MSGLSSQVERGANECNSNFISEHVLEYQLRVCSSANFWKNFEQVFMVFMLNEFETVNIATNIDTHRKKNKLRMLES